MPQRLVLRECPLGSKPERHGCHKGVALLEEAGGSLSGGRMPGGGNYVVVATS